MSFDKKEYLKDQYCDKYNANVVKCTKNKNEQYEVILDKTIFYPHLSGGQPRDFGTIDGIEVLNVYEDENEEIIHVLGSKVSGSVQLSIDFKRRFDHMQQHTGQHILSGVFYRRYNGKTIGFHLGDEYTTIDLDLQNITKEIMEQVELECNSIIHSNINVDTKVLDFQGAIEYGVRKYPEGQELIRAVKIGDKDCVACCGTHVNTTGEIGIVKVVKWEKYKNGTRVEFLCGERAVKDYIVKNQILQELGNSFSCHTLDLIDNIKKYKENAANLQKKYSVLKDSMSKYIAKDLINTAVLKDNVNYIIHVFEDESIKDVRHIATNIVKEDDVVCAFIIKNSADCSLLFAQSKNVDIDILSCFNQCVELTGARGGGNSKLVQATSPDNTRVDECYYLISNYFFG